ncbi:MAG: hypothetical protein J6T22_05830 [Bacteroidales bacterium]|nr:hypothetical protein [Bacteroidales bacterium]
MNAIGGYFELELPEHGRFPHEDGVLLNSGRNALEYVLQALGDVNHVFVPYYTCDVVLEPLVKLGIPYTFYSINQNLELKEWPTLQSGEYLIFNNYFGIKDEYVVKLAKRYGSQLIVDNAQAWFTDPIGGVSAIYSPRKYVGLPDGGVAYCPRSVDEQAFEQDLSYERCSHLLKRLDLGPSEGYADFRANSKQLVGQPVKRMSKLTQRMLCSVDFEAIKDKRRKNFGYLHEHLKETNLFDMPSMDSFACPMVYPYLTDDASLKQRLIENKVFVATYWPNVLDWCDSDALENSLARNMVFLPVDQRYGIDEMQRIIDLIGSRP